jgi:His-Xaa-Ser system protein HxsD
MAENVLQEKTVKVDLNIYKQEVITATVYKFTGRHFVSQNKVDNDVEVTFTAKPEQAVNFDLLAKEFENELIDQQVRYDTEQKFGHIRNLIVEKAFNPIS